MKKRISITITTALLHEIDARIGPKGSRSAFLEEILRAHFRRKIGERDLLLINANADQLNREAMDVLRYQADIFDILEDQANTQ